jgi:pimeloyl-ACP methyl ester carboxylesterase
LAAFVLIHGGFSGGWLWKDVRPLLHDAGHESFTPTLTGVGERVHLANSDIDLDTHVQDVVGVLHYEDLSEVILVGHSSSTMVATGVAERVPERLACLVYLDTMVPNDGQSWADLLGPDIWSPLWEATQSYGDGWRVPPPPDNPMYTPHPAKTVTQPLSVQNPRTADVPRGYIHCTETPPDWFMGLGLTIADAAAEARAAGWHYREMPSDHLPMQTMPKELTELLLELA